MHDRGSCITTKMLLSKNADVSIKESNIEGNKLVTDRKWSAPEAVWEIVEAISNYTVLTYYIRNYSYEGLAISRAYHDMGFFLGTVSSEKEQMTLLEDSFNKLLSRNSNRAKNQTHCHPLTYEEVKGALNSFLHSKGKHETGLYGESDISDLNLFTTSVMARCGPVCGQEEDRRGGQDQGGCQEGLALGLEADGLEGPGRGRATEHAQEQEQEGEEEEV